MIRYIELNPVRAAMVDRPEHYRWSSVHTHVGTAQDPLITCHPAYLALGSERDVRARVYRQWLYTPLDADELARIRCVMAQEKALGDPRFHAMVEKALNRTVVVTPRGRPGQRDAAN